MDLLFLPDPFEGGPVRFLIHEFAGVGVPFRPGVILGVIHLASFLYHSVSVTVSGRWIFCHLVLLCLRVMEGAATPPWL